VAAVSESVRLAALRAIFAEMMAASEFAGFEDRMTPIDQPKRNQGHSEDRQRSLRRPPEVDGTVGPCRRGRGAAATDCASATLSVGFARCYTRGT